MRKGIATASADSAGPSVSEAKPENSPREVSPIAVDELTCELGLADATHDRGGSCRADCHRVATLEWRAPTLASSRANEKRVMT